MDNNKFLNIIINLAVFQGITCILMLCIPSFHNFAIRLYGGNNIYITGVRIYGISSDYTYSTPIYHGILASFYFYKNFNSLNLKKFIKLILIIIAILFNGRTGLIIFSANLLIILFVSCIKKGQIIKFFFYIIFILTAWIITLNITKKYVPNTYKFVNSLFVDTGNLISSEKKLTGNYKILNNSFYFPKGKNLVFGEGARVYKAKQLNTYYKHSDIGYVNDIFLGGIIYALLLYSSYLYLIFKNISDWLLRFIIILSLAIANFKGEIFRASIVIFLIIFICYYERKKESVIKN